MPYPRFVRVGLRGAFVTAFKRSPDSFKYALFAFVLALSQIGLASGSPKYSCTCWFQTCTPVQGAVLCNLLHDQETLKKQYQQLQGTVVDTNQRLDSLQSLATEVAMSYGVLRYHPAAFDEPDSPANAQDAFDRSVEQYTFLKRNAAVIAISNAGLRLMPAMSFADSTYTPAIWPVLGHITDSFGQRLDPFSGEGAFHTGVDVASDYGAPVHATADGVITIAGNHSGYGRVVVIDHGFGITTWYAHLSAFSAVPGARVKRGEVVGYTGISGRSTGPHVHYEVRMNNAPVNPWRYMRSNPTGD